MLISLTIQNIVLIEKLTVNFAAGLCGLTGETGAGKSILLDSLGLALGARAGAGLVRKGAEKAQVIAEFEVDADHAANGLLQEAAFDGADDGTLILRRTLNADGRSKAYINDQPVSAGLLRDVGASLVEIHGQFDTQGLLNPAHHLGMLDDYTGTDVKAVRTAWRAWQDELKALEEMREGTSKAREEEEYLRQAVEDLDALEPQVGEEEKLASLRERLINCEQVMASLNEAYAALSGDSDPVRSAWGALERAAAKLGEDAQMTEAIGALERASSETQEALALIQSLSTDLSEGDQDLEAIDDRLHALRTQARKHDCAVDELPCKRDALAAQLNLIEHGDEALAAQQAKTDKAQQAYIDTARIAHERREASAKKLDDLVATELPPLKLEKARFVTQVLELDEQEWGVNGLSQVRFLVATNPGAEPGPLNKIASGGEMARFMLALKVVMASAGGPGTLIFDEVDAGVGGAVADAVGERLHRLTHDKDRQVMVVTHSPQVAARSDAQWIVCKDETPDGMRTNIISLDDMAERREEIARMLAGAQITDEARAAAEKLLEAAA